MTKTGYIMINSDEWEDAGTVYKLIEYNRRKNSTAVELVLELKGGHRQARVVPYHWIEWIDYNDES